MKQQSEKASTLFESEISLLELLLVLVQKKRFILAFTAAGAVISIIWSLLTPNIYTSTARILPPQKDSGSGLVAALGQLGGLASMAGLGGLVGSSDLYVGILKSRSVSDAVIKKLNLQTEFKSKNMDDARKRFEKVVKYQAGKDGIITITANSKKPELAASLANACVSELLARSVQLNLVKAGSERIFLEKRLEVVKGDLKKAEEALKGFAQQNKAIQIDSQAKASIEGVARLKAELATREVQLASLRSYQTDESPEVKTLLAAIRRLHGEISRYAGYADGGEGIPTVGSIPSLGMQYARFMRDLKVQEAVFEQLTKQYELAKVAEAKETSTLQVLDDAVVPIRKSKPKRSLIVILTTVCSFFVSIVFAVATEYAEKMGEEDRQRWQTIKRQIRIWR
ncbi:tyrosine-protein kinase etk [Geobacter sp. OR-1]|uniref:GumC family protein n=1 Tax=Geobacter sp. OR-1 TaxID=1266765 RepID=UPI000542857F|nr:Wzz/FepE/Etk N-terminal domain-containing protein [Geobacter sp. OR-1]GAM08246.1 tyrosine-protein kinase etk [Geobacter sp. OR-1]